MKEVIDENTLSVKPFIFFKKKFYRISAVCLRHGREVFFDTKNGWSPSLESSMIVGGDIDEVKIYTSQEEAEKDLQNIKNNISRSNKIKKILT